LVLVDRRGDARHIAGELIGTHRCLLDVAGDLLSRDGLLLDGGRDRRGKAADVMQ